MNEDLQSLTKILEEFAFKKTGERWRVYFLDNRTLPDYLVMNLPSANKYVSQLRSKKHRLYGFTLHLQKKILINKDYPQEYWETFFHELAHAMCGWTEGHGPTWVKIAGGFGCNTNGY